MKYIELFEVKRTNPIFIQAAKRGSASKINDLIKDNPHIINIIDDQYRTALMWASLNSYLMVVDILLKANAEINSRDKNGRSALMMASTPKIINKLLDAGADVNIQNDQGNTIIMEYLDYSGDQFFKYIDKFLEKGLNLDIKNNMGLNFYELLKFKQEKSFVRTTVYSEIEDYLNKNFPQYKEQWELDKAVKDFNL